MSEQAKQKMGGWLSAFLGIGMVGAALYWTLGRDKEHKRERRAFEKLELSSMSPRAVWDAALDLHRKRRTELSAENVHLSELVEKGAGLIEISEGLKKCATMLADKSVPEKVKTPILDHWFKKWWRFMGFEMVLMEQLFANLDTGYIEKVRERLADYDAKRAQAREEIERERLENDLCCSFCGKSKKQVKQIIAGPSVYICAECVDLCNEIVAKESGRATRMTTLEDRIAELESEVEDLTYELAEARALTDDG